MFDAADKAYRNRCCFLKYFFFQLAKTRKDGKVVVAEMFET